MTEYRIEIYQRGRWVQVGESYKEQRACQEDIWAIMDTSAHRVRMIKTEVVGEWKP